MNGDPFNVLGNRFSGKRKRSWEEWKVSKLNYWIAFTFIHAHLFKVRDSNLLFRLFVKICSWSFRDWNCIHRSLEHLSGKCTVLMNFSRQGLIQENMSKTLKLNKHISMLKGITSIIKDLRTKHFIIIWA